jgi:hypothetical protein
MREREGKSIIGIEHYLESQECPLFMPRAYGLWTFLSNTQRRALCGEL